MLAPIVMGAQEWDDHDRSKKLLAPDIAKDYLNSCPKNAVLFTFGDNDTYPLWYAQEVEGVRPDIRIINTSLLGIDWYVNELRRKVNESDPINVLWNEDQIRGLSYIEYKPDASSSKPVMILDEMRNKVGSLLNDDNKSNNRIYFSDKHLIVPVDTSYVRQAGLVKPTDTLSTQIQIDIPENKSYLSLDQLTMLNILATSNWRRPICFTSPYGETGFGPYLRQEGLIYHLVPVRSDANRTRAMDVDKTSDLLLHQFRSGNANIAGVYFDEENRRHLLSIRSTYAIAASNLADEGRKADAQAILKKSESLIIPSDLPYAMVSRNNSHNQVGMMYLESAYKAGDMEFAGKLKQAITKDLTDQKKYYNYLKNYKEDFYAQLANEDQDCDQLLRIMDQLDKTYNPKNTNVKEVPGQLRNAADSVGTKKNK
jgi:hypothetical protein